MKQEKLVLNKDSLNYILENVNIIPINENIVLRKKTLIITNGIIERIIDSKDNYIKKHYKVINLKGKYIMPTLSDAHVHLPKDEKELEKFFILNLINGVTKLRSMRGNWSHYDWKKKYNTTNSIYPELYLSAPPIHRKHNLSEEQVISYVESAKKQEFNFIKILSIKDEITFKILDSICKINNIPLGGHFPKNIPDKVIFKSNYTSFEHLGGLIGNKTNFTQRLNQIKHKDIFICPTLKWYEISGGLLSISEMQQEPGVQYIDSNIKKEWVEKSKSYRNKLGVDAFNEEVSKYTNEMQ